MIPTIGAFGAIMNRYIPFLFLPFVLSAHAAVPEAVTNAITTASTDVSTVGGAVLAVIVAIAAFRWIRRAI